MQIVNCEQNSLEWFEARKGIPTASSFSKVLSGGRGETRKKYMLSLAGEILTGNPREPFSNEHTERGHLLEPEARAQYEFINEVACTLVGFVKNNEAGASPDAFIENSGLLEIKTKLAHLQIEIILKDKVPNTHKPQVQGQMWVCERDWCDFLSYSPGLPLFIKRIYRDEKYIKETLEPSVKMFNEELLEIVEKIRSFDQCLEA